MYPALRSLMTISALSLATALPLAAPAVAYDDLSKASVNVEKGSLGLKGHDPVAYFTLGKPTKGDPQFNAAHAGATYHFATAAHRDAFVADPAKYLPQYGGFCAWAASSGYKADADPTAWKIVDGKLYVNYNASVQKSWAADAAGLIKKADVNWPKIAAKPPKELK